MINRRNFLKTVGVGVAATSIPHFVDAQKENRKPNIIFIIVDDMGYADLGCYGSKAIKTPNIDRLAAEGMKFTDAYSGSAVCAPARSTLMTGKHMGHASLRGNSGGVSIPADEVTIAEILKKAGYATGGFGKWGIADIGREGVPERKGFDLFYGYYHQVHAHEYYPEYLVRNSEKVFLKGNKTAPKTDYSHYLIFEEQIKFIKKNKDRPFFCYGPWTPPHGKYQLPADEPARKLYKDKKWNNNAKIIASMDSMIDRQVGGVMQLLKDLNIDQHTILFFCSDNGASQRQDGTLNSSGPLRGQKRTMYEGGLRVPFVVRWPGKIKPGTVSHLPQYFPDMFPTFAEIAGVKTAVPKDVDGISIVPTLTGKGSQKKHEYMYWELPKYSFGKRLYNPDELIQAVRKGKWKLVRTHQKKPWELYDLDKDIGEKNNLAKKNPEIVKDLTDWVKNNRTEMIEQTEAKLPKGKRFF